MAEKEDILKEARQIIDGHATDRDRGKERSMGQIVEIFNNLTRSNLSEHEGYIFMVVLKLVRMERSPSNIDNYIDGVAYIQLAWEEALNQRSEK